MVTLIASVGERGEIGRDGNLCWHIPEDLRRFKELTMGSAVVMGRNTWESLPRRPLPGRKNIVVSSSGGRQDDGAVWVKSLGEALEAAGDGCFIIGGESVYAASMPLAGRLEITRIMASDPSADRFFPAIDPGRWRLVEAGEPMTSKNGLQFRYETYESCGNKP